MPAKTTGMKSKAPIERIRPAVRPPATRTSATAPEDLDVRGRADFAGAANIRPGDAVNMKTGTDGEIGALNGAAALAEMFKKTRLPDGKKAPTDEEIKAAAEAGWTKRYEEQARRNGWPIPAPVNKAKK